MKRKKLKLTVDKELKHIKKYATRIIGTKDNEEVIHQFRVEFKKLRALIRLSRSAPSKEKKLTIPLKLKKIYRLAGSIRTLQIYHQRIAPSLKKRNTYLIDIVKQINQLEQQLTIAIKHFQFQKMAKNIRGRLPKRLSKKVLEKFIRKKSTAIKTGFSQAHLSNDELHTIRKDLKDIMYNLALFHLTNRKHLPTAAIASSKKLNKLSSQLNKHQDYVEALSLVDTALSSHLAKSTRAVLQRIRKKWLHKKLARITC